MYMNKPGDQKTAGKDDGSYESCDDYDCYEDVVVWMKTISLQRPRNDHNFHLRL